MGKTRIILILIVVSVLLLFADRTGWLRPLTAPLQGVFAPLRYVVYRIERSSLYTVRLVTEIGKLQQRNRTLESENVSLKAQNTRIKTLEKENDTLKKQLSVKLFEQRLVQAHVYGQDSETKELIIRTAEPVSQGSMVVVGDNYIGTVSSSSGPYAKVRTIVDPLSKIPVATTKGAKGILEGRYRTEAVVNNFRTEDTIAEKELVKTTGESGVEKDLVVGEITKVHASEKQLIREVLVAPLFNLLELETVFVVKP